MKRILLVTRPIAPPWDEASKNFAYHLAQNIDKRDFELHLMTKGVLADLPDEVIQENIYTRSENDFSFSQKIRSLMFQLKNRNSFNIAHYFFTPTKLNSFIIKRFVKNRKLRTVQTVATLREDLFSDAEIKTLIFADYVATYSDYAKNKLNLLGFKKVSRIYPGIDLQQYLMRPKNQELMKIFNFSAGDFVIHFGGEYVRLGAIDDVVDAFISVSQKIPNAKLFLAVRVKNSKDAEKKEQVISKLKKQKLLEKVAFFDDGRFEMEEIYNLADISLFPVRNMHGKFDVPLVVVEAMACEKPVILSDIPILQEFATKDNSVTIQKGDVAGLARAISDLHDNIEKRKLLGKQARKYVEDNFDIKKVAGIYEKIYEKL